MDLILSNVQEQRLKKRGQWQAALLMLIIFIPMALAMLVYHTGTGLPQSTTNKGILLSAPLSIDSIALYDNRQDPWQLAQQNPQWRWVYFLDGSCQTACQQQLYKSRQAHIRLAEKAGRVERLVIATHRSVNPALSYFLQQQHPRLQLLSTSEEIFRHWQRELHSRLPVDTSVDQAQLLMDPQGWLLMFYGSEHTGGDLLGDIRKLLRTSYEDQQ